MVEVERELGVIGEEIVQAASDYLDEHRINVDGDIKKSLYQEVERVKDALKLTVGAGVAHAVYVHEGTKPHWPPVAPIREWVRKKLGIADRAQIRRVAFLVARKIARSGTRPKPFLDVPFQAALKGLQPRIEAAYARGFNLS